MYKEVMFGADIYSILVVLFLLALRVEEFTDKHNCYLGASLENPEHQVKSPMNQLLIRIYVFNSLCFCIYIWLYNIIILYVVIFMSNIYTYIDPTHFALATSAGCFLYGSHLHLCLAIHPLEVRPLFQGFYLQDFCWSWLWKQIVCHIWRFKCCNNFFYLVWYVHFVLCILYLQAVTYLSDQSRSNFWHPKSLEGGLSSRHFR